MIKPAVDYIKEMDEVRDFPNNTCPASRHAQMIAEGLIKDGVYEMIEDDPEYVGVSIASVVASLWRERRENAELKRRLLMEGEKGKPYERS